MTAGDIPWCYPHTVKWSKAGFVCLLAGCVTSQQHGSVCQGQFCPDMLTCCNTKVEITDQTFYPTQTHFTGTGPTSTSADPKTPGASQGSHRSASLKIPTTQARTEPRILRSQGGQLNHKANEAVQNITAMFTKSVKYKSTHTTEDAHHWLTVRCPVYLLGARCCLWNRRGQL